MSSYIDNFRRVLNDPGESAGVEHYFQCPFPGCCGYRKRKFQVNARSGLWYCFHCGTGGNAKEFIRLMGDEANIGQWEEGPIEGEIRVKRSITKKVRKIWQRAIELSRPLSEEHAEMLQARAIDPDKVLYGSAWSGLWETLVHDTSFEEVEGAGLIYRTKDGKIRPCWCIRPGRLLIGYPGNPKLVPFFAGYARCPDREPGEDEESYEKRKDRWVKCAGPTGFPSQIYGIIPKDCPLLIITEGQLKAEAAAQSGFPCVGLPGISAQHKPVATKCRAAGIKRAVILFDSQANGQDEVDLQANNLARELLKAKIPAYRAILPLEGDKTDIDSFLGCHPKEDLAEIICEAASRPYRFIEEESDGKDAATAEGLEERLL